MDSLHFIKEMISQPTLRVFLSDSVPVDESLLDEETKDFLSDKPTLRTLLSDSVPVSEFPRPVDENFRDSLRWLQRIIKRMLNSSTVEDTEDKKVVLFKCLRLVARLIGHASRKHPSGSKRHYYVKEWKKKLSYYIGEMTSLGFFKKTEAEGGLEHKDKDAVINSLGDIKIIEEFLTDKADSSTCLTNEKHRAFFLMTAFPALRELQEPYKIVEFLLELTTELDNLPQLIFKAFEGQPLALLLLGSLLSLKKRAYDTWLRVKDELGKITVSDNDAANNHMERIISYCYDLPYFLQPCFLYLACYPKDYEIPARSLTEIWIAEEFVIPEEGETIEETANKYLEQLVQRSLVYVSKRSLLGTIKYCRVHHSIHKFAIEKSREEEFLVANPDQEEMEDFLPRVAFHNDEKKQYTDEVYLWTNSLLAFDNPKITDDFRLSGLYPLVVLESRKSAILKPNLTYADMDSLQYLGLRGSTISEIPENLRKSNHCLQTLDVRDTKIETLPESLWNIKTLRHVYVNPSLQIKGPPSTADLSNLQILKTVAVHESWLENFPRFLINLRKLALSNRDNPDGKPNPYWKSISKLLSHMDNLLSMAIIGDIVPSELVDIRAFRNLETVKSIEFEGEWICRKLFIDNVEFPPNLTKLTLTKSGLKEDPMPRLERLEALKFLSLQDGAYAGKKMVCSANGFPKLQFLVLKKLENLENLEVKPGAMSKLVTLDADECPNLKKPLNLVHVTIKGIDN